jgi:serine O-acetyltransferase
MRRKLGADIHPAAQIGRRFTIDHGIGVVIGATAVIGDDCLIYQGVTLGMTGKQPYGKRHPSLGNDVLVGANATILGDIYVGDGARVGAGAVVLADVEPHTTVVGVPARPVTRSAQRPALRLVDGASGMDARDAAFGEDVRWSCGL